MLVSTCSTVSGIICRLLKTIFRKYFLNPICCGVLPYESYIVLWQLNSPYGHFWAVFSLHSLNMCFYVFFCFLLYCFFSCLHGTVYRVAKNSKPRFILSHNFILFNPEYCHCIVLYLLCTSTVLRWIKVALNILFIDLKCKSNKYYIILSLVIK